MAVSSRGDVLVLALLLGLAAAQLESGVATVLAGVAVLLRWGTTSLGALAGAQAVLGAAGLTGPTPAAMSSWLSAVAIVGAAAPFQTHARPTDDQSRGRALLVLAALPFGLAAAAVAAGSGPGGNLPLRAAVSVVAVMVAAGAAALRSTRAGRAILVVSLVSAVAALPLAAMR